ncbi:MAG: hypothetical protein HC941_24605 [Microcoleus sp. SU_5_3]|nr:hypothetical protein [Microcoleus sp. SU_5_3]
MSPKKSVRQDILSSIGHDLKIKNGEYWTIEAPVFPIFRGILLDATFPETFWVN